MQKDTTLNAQSIDTTSHDGAHEALWWLDFYTTKGRKAENQDSLLVTTCLPYRKIAETIGINNQHYHAPLLVLIADGVSACQFPKQASRLVVNTVAHHLTLALENTLLDKTVSTSFDDQLIKRHRLIAIDELDTAIAANTGTIA